MTAPSNLTIIGIRHHSPACARLVARAVAELRPAEVLIEGPSDFNPRIDELALPHRLPIALYSYARGEHGAAQCWFPFLDYSPEWIALGAGRQAGAKIRFIDLPHWHYRAEAEQRRRGQEQAGQGRYGRVSEALCRRFSCDGDDALWDRLFESAPDDELAARLDSYFARLRGDDPGSDEDRAREGFMARHIAAAVMCAGKNRVLVVCGGWHRPVLEARVAALLAAGDHAEPVAPEMPAENAAGCYLVPYEFRQVESLAGYGAGMQSPLFYQWCWEEGAASALDKATAVVVQRLRARRISLGTADFVALRGAVAGLGRLRGNEPPNRVDLLDGLLMAVVKEALDRPAPWSGRSLLRADDHPLLREALLALTGDARGQLDGATPQPPLLRDVEDILARLDLSPATQAREIRLDRREPAHQARAETLWRLKLLGIGGIVLKETRASHAARHLPEALQYEEIWSVEQGRRWHADLIEASRHGPTLAQAAENALLEKLGAPGQNIGQLAQGLVRALRAGFHSLGARLLDELAALLPSQHDHGTLASAGHTLVELARTGFWGCDALPLLRGPLVAIGERLLWLLDDHRAGSSGILEQDTAAVGFLVDLLELNLTEFDRAFAVDVLERTAHRADAPHALRGAALGAAYGLGMLTAETVLRITRAIPPRDGLGDFLFGLFSRTRELLTRDTAIVEAIQGALESMSGEDFLVALPQLRGAFAWFPPRERGAVAVRVAEVLGLSRSEQFKLLRLPGGADELIDAKQIEAQAVAWARELGILP